MPIYDRRCTVCAWTAVDVIEPVTPPAPVVCPDGHATERVWLTGSRSAAVHGDDRFIGGVTFENIGHAPVTVHSRSELKRHLDAEGIKPFVRHVGAPGSDKSKHTTRWI